jgi:hypothetical protein
MELITHLHLVTRLKMCVAVPLLPMCAFRVWAGTALPLHSPLIHREDHVCIVCRIVG